MKDVEIINGERHVWVFSRWHVPWIFLRETFAYMNETTVFHWAWTSK